MKVFLLAALVVAGCGDKVETTSEDEVEFVRPKVAKAKFSEVPDTIAISKVVDAKSEKYCSTLTLNDVREFEYTERVDESAHELPKQTSVRGISAEPLWQFTFGGGYPAEVFL